MSWPANMRMRRTSTSRNGVRPFLTGKDVGKELLEERRVGVSTSILDGNAPLSLASSVPVGLPNGTSLSSADTTSTSSDSRGPLYGMTKNADPLEAQDDADNEEDDDNADTDNDVDVTVQATTLERECFK